MLSVQDYPSIGSNRSNNAKWYQTRIISCHNTSILNWKDVRYEQNWKSRIKCIGFDYFKIFHFLISVAVFDKTIYIISQINILYSPRSFFPLYYLLIRNRTMSGSLFNTNSKWKNFNYNNLILKLIDCCLQAKELYFQSFDFERYSSF